MQKVPDIWYSRINFALGVGALLIALSFVVFKVFGIVDSTEVLGLTNVAVAGFAVVCVQAFGLYFLERKKLKPVLSSLVTLVLSGMASLLLIHISGGITSVWLFIWSVLIFFSGAFGIKSLLVTLGVILVYLVTAPDGLLQNSTATAATAIYSTANLLMAMISYFSWEHVGGKTIEHANTELQAEQLKSEIVINSIADGVIVVNNAGQIVIFNPAAHNITGWKQEDATGLDVTSVLKFVTPAGEGQFSELPRNEHPIVKALDSSSGQKYESINLTTASKKTVELSLSVSLISAANVKQGVVAVFRDVSAARQAERQRAEFISTASHEMRTPVAAIEGYLALALNEKVAKIDSKARNYLEKAHESTEHLGQLFKDLLAAAKSEDGRLENHPKVIDIHQLLTQLTEDARFSVEKKGLKLNYAVAGDSSGSHGENTIVPLMYIHVDEERIREVITNLINNAVKFTEDGSVTVGLRAMPDYIQISVRDTGYGIPEEDIQHLFQKFYRVDNSNTRAIGGTGLGLFISKNIVEMYKGRIWVESKLGEGSTFYINLPRLDADRAAQLKQQEEGQVKPLELEGRL
ncbi:TPA: PAS domain S-box protein [Candidatus Saccharibacteria bacterium]|nr:PAS domain S-box protein [Candidatus Saccharibacteria bacterium]HIO87595.1 PAS domain S-box protein [Candidatus Saccharibacteria bacterium]